MRAPDKIWLDLSTVTYAMTQPCAYDGYCAYIRSDLTPPAADYVAGLEAAAHAGRELASYASYSEIVGAVGHNRSQIREWCDKVFAAGHVLDAALAARPASPDTRVGDLISAIEAAGVMPEGYCFCSENRIGDDSKIHEPECRDLRKALKEFGRG